MTKRTKGLAGLTALLAACGLLWHGAAMASPSTLQSAHYKLVESSLGNGGLLQSSSSSYVLGESIGDAAVGHAASDNYQVNAGSKTSPDPALTFTINAANTNFGSFSPTVTSTTTASFQVSDYTSYGYIVELSGDPPTNGNHTLPGMATTGPPQPGIEQFGINLVANTSPKVFGANPDHGELGTGDPMPDYGTANQFRYVPGEPIVKAQKSGGISTYTISYIVDVGSLTPGGQYRSNQVLICVATY